jgi:hypothetical protein
MTMNQLHIETTERWACSVSGDLANGQYELLTNVARWSNWSFNDTIPACDFMLQGIKQPGVILLFYPIDTLLKLSVKRREFSISFNELDILKLSFGTTDILPTKDRKLNAAVYLYLEYTQK